MGKCLSVHLLQGPRRIERSEEAGRRMRLLLLVRQRAEDRRFRHHFGQTGLPQSFLSKITCRSTRPGGPGGRNSLFFFLSPAVCSSGISQRSPISSLRAHVPASLQCRARAHWPGRTYRILRMGPI